MSEHCCAPLWNPGRYWAMTEGSCCLSDSFLPQRRDGNGGAAAPDKEQMQMDKQSSSSSLATAALFLLVE